MSRKSYIDRMREEIRAYLGEDAKAIYLSVQKFLTEYKNGEYVFHKNHDLFIESLEILNKTEGFLEVLKTMHYKVQLFVLNNAGKFDSDLALSCLRIIKSLGKAKTGILDPVFIQNHSSRLNLFLNGLSYRFQKDVINYSYFFANDVNNVEYTVSRHYASFYNRHLIVTTLFALRSKYSAARILEICYEWRKFNLERDFTAFLRVIENWDELKDYPLDWAVTVSR
jgi:hypothetical protein